MRGLLPRCFEYLFEEVAKICNRTKLTENRQQIISSFEQYGENVNNEKSLHNEDVFFGKDIAKIDFEVKCSYIEIYNETIYDLLDISHQKLQIREDRGQTFLENCTETHVRNISEVIDLI